MLIIFFWVELFLLFSFNIFHIKAKQFDFRGQCGKPSTTKLGVECGGKLCVEGGRHLECCSSGNQYWCCVAGQCASKVGFCVGDHQVDCAAEAKSHVSTCCDIGTEICCSDFTQAYCCDAHIYKSCDLKNHNCSIKAKDLNETKTNRVRYRDRTNKKKSENYSNSSKWFQNKSNNEVNFKGCKNPSVKLVDGIPCGNKGIHNGNLCVGERVTCCKDHLGTYWCCAGTDKCAKDKGGCLHNNQYDCSCSIDRNCCCEAREICCNTCSKKPWPYCCPMGTKCGTMGGEPDCI